MTLPQFTGDADRFRRAVHLAEDSGLDSIWLFDHLWPLSGGKERSILECWTSLAYIASITDRIGIGTLVTRSTLRHPVLLAKMIATVASVAPGRLTVTVGSGGEASRAENEAFGIEYYAKDERIEQLRSTVEIVRYFLDGGTVDHHDSFADVTDLPASPVAAERPAVWVGGRADDTLEIAATRADGWNGWGGTPERFAQDAGSVLAYAGDRPVELTWGGLVVLDETDAKAAGRAKDRSDDAIVGGPETVAEALGGFAATGATHLIVTPAGPWNETTVDLLATEVAPRLRTLPEYPPGV